MNIRNELKRKIEEEWLENVKGSINERYIPIKVEIIRLLH